MLGLHEVVLILLLSQAEEVPQALGSSCLRWLYSAIV